MKTTKYNKTRLIAGFVVFIYVCALRKQQDDELGADDAQEHG
jgi:hypothetical protein